MELSELELSRNNFPIIINYRTATIEVVIPVFAGILCSLMLCAVIGVSFGVYSVPKILEPVVEIVSEEKETEVIAEVPDETADTVLRYFRNPLYKEWVISFFTGICSDREIAQAVLENADRFNIPPALAFALSWEESKFNPQAVNRNNRNGSVDRGLFQLNNLSFPNLDTVVFFDIQSNAYYGMGHLRYCMDSGGNEVSALAMYNAGTGRIKSTGAPEVTLKYISRILENRKKFESQFNEKLTEEEKYRFTEAMPSEKQDDEQQLSSWRWLNTSLSGYSYNMTRR